MDRTNGVNDRRIIAYHDVITPDALRLKVPLTADATANIIESRNSIERILDGEDDRLLVIAGPCSIHNVDEAKEYASWLRDIAKTVNDKMFVVMRTYFEKPRTTTGWTGLIYDPYINGTGNFNAGLKMARDLLVFCAKIGLPTATEMLDPRIPQYIDDSISYAAIGARTTESQPHRDMASGLSMPVGFKNGTSGSVQTAIDAVKRSRYSQSFFGMNMRGDNKRVVTEGNPYTHIILRGGRCAPNYDEDSVADVQRELRECGLPDRIVIDCSHDNSRKDHEKQSGVFYEVMRQRAAGNKSIVGVMLEGNVEAGNQKIPADLSGFDSSRLIPGVSVTDKCIAAETMEQLLKYRR